MSAEEEMKNIARKLINEYKTTEEVDFLKKLRSESGSSTVLFYYLLEQLFLEAEKQGIVLASKGLLKHYTKSKYKEDSDYVYIGGHATEDDEKIIQVDKDTFIKKGLFCRLLKYLGLPATLNTYVKYLLINEEEINESHYFNEDEINKFRDIDKTIEKLYEEFDEKIKESVVKIKK